jgi:hypothetical protein
VDPDRREDAGRAQPGARHLTKRDPELETVLLWLLNNYVPMDSKIKTIINVVVVIAIVVWLLQAFGVLGSLRDLRIQ